MGEDTLKRDLPEIDVELSIPLSPLAPRAARLALAEVIGIPEPTLSVTQLLVSEVLSNSVRKSRLVSNSLVRVRISSNDGTVRVELDDEGFGFTLPPSPGQLSEESMALYVVSYLADQWGIDRSGNATRVWFEIKHT
jgi:anti-sigma regulatory factor (Ser/Thr protein kinase)